MEFSISAEGEAAGDRERGKKGTANVGENKQQASTAAAAAAVAARTATTRDAAAATVEVIKTKEKES